MAAKNGRFIRFYVAGYAVGLEMQVTLNYTVDTLETTSKDSAGVKTFIAGDGSWTASGSAHLDWSAQQNATQLFTLIKAGSAVALDIGSSSDSVFYSGNGIMTSWSFDASNNAVVDLSFEWQGDGSLSQATART